MTPPSALKRLKTNLESTKLVLFVGAGVSRSVGLPSWDGLVDQLLDDADRLTVEQREEIEVVRKRRGLIDALTAITHATGKTQFNHLVENIIDDSHINTSGVPIFVAIQALSSHLHGIVTTNLDRLLERTLPTWESHTDAPGFIAQRRQWIIKLHGTLHEPNTWVLTRPQYRRALYTMPKTASLYDGLFWGGTTLLFIGYGLKDPDFDIITERIAALTDGTAPRHYAIVDASEFTGYDMRDYADRGITLLGYANTDGKHGGLTEFLTYLAS